MCDENGDYPVGSDSSWEPDVLAKELNRSDAVTWYRNPARATQESLGVVYELDGMKIVRPDFIFFAQESGSIVADLIDPHGHHLADALPKFRGLVSYAKAHTGQFRRIEAISKVGNDLRYLDLIDAETQEAALKADSAIELYNSSFGRPY
jgi:type III restriction enzyme